MHGEGTNVQTSTVEAFAYCREVTKQHAKNFYYAFLFLPKAKREAIYAVYAFCRYCDDIADEEMASESRPALLAAWRQELDNCYNGKPTHQITEALHQVIETYPIPKHYFEELMRGVEMDFDIRRYEANLLRLAELAVDRGVKVILITDQWTSPIADVAEWLSDKLV